MTRLIVPITDLSAPLAQQAEEAHARGADLIELRVDLIGEADAVAAYLASPDRRACILTVRCRSEGGAWDASESERISLIERLGLQRPDYIDVELAAWRSSANLRQKIGLVCRRRSGGEPADNLTRPKSELILSVHDFQGMTAWSRDWDELSASPAAILKMAVTPRDSRDALSILERARDFSRRGDERGALLIGMGPAGEMTRVLAKSCGAWGAFAALDSARASAPGQIDLAELTTLYRWKSLSPATRVYGVIGWPVQHSLSPRFHNEWMAARTLDGVYVLLPVEPSFEALAEFLDRAAALNAPRVGGFSVTLPHKENALRWLRERGGQLSSRAARIGAVNTLICREGPDPTWLGENTDYDGVLAMLREAGLNPAQTPAPPLRAAVLGAGGAARAAIVALLDAGIACTVYNRSPERAAQLVAQLNREALSGVPAGGEARPALVSAPWAARLSHNAEILVNCTSLGMHPALDDSPLPAGAIAPARAVLETIYTPRETQLVRDAIAAGCAIGYGSTMFNAQAERQAQLWHTTAPGSLQ